MKVTFTPSPFIESLKPTLLAKFGKMKMPEYIAIKEKGLKKDA